MLDCTIGSALPDWPRTYHEITICDLKYGCEINQKLRAFVQMASCDEHVTLLTCLFPEYEPDLYVTLAYRAISQTGMIISVLDRDDPNSHNLIKIAAHAAQITKESRYGREALPAPRPEQQAVAQAQERTQDQTQEAQLQTQGS